MIAVELRLSQALLPIKADPVQLEQILMNLGVNARDAMPEGGVLSFETQNLTVDRDAGMALQLPEAGEYVLLRVSDTGHGMDNACKDRIFEPFFTTKEVGKGTGLGLAMVYGIVQNHSGRILCTSSPGKGATFDVYFPALRKKELKTEADLSRGNVTGGEETILLVDDEDSILDIGSDMLQRFGYRVATAVSGEAAIAIYKRAPRNIDLVILDINMPGMGGNRCLKELIDINPHAKVIIASGYASNGYEKDALEAGAVGFIGKPYKMAEMLKMVRRVLDA
jgi:CheY-like chemotaxis protein